jgi:L-ascorbate metabolism protein UlaG (beta-lactamase superfamily)
MIKGLAKILTLILAVFFVVRTEAQIYDKKTGGGKPDPQLSQDDNYYLDRQAKVFLDTVTVLLKQFPPTTFPEARERGLAKLLLDAVFHEHFAVYRKPVQQYFRGQVDKVIHELETIKVENGVRIWKIYDMGFIARTKSVTLAFDLVTGITSSSPEFAMSAEQVERLTKQCDALLITHRHPDHADKVMATKFLELGLPVLAPAQVWKEDPISENIIHPERISEKIQQLKLKKSTLEMIVYPGHQMKSIDNNVYLIKTPEGITLAHNGDQINEGDFMVDWEWIDKIKDTQKVDVLMTNAWTMDIFRMVKGFNPKLVMPGHEIEMGHTVWDRLPFWGDDEYLKLNYAELKKSEYPVVVTVWGESYHFNPKK